MSLEIFKLEDIGDADDPVALLLLWSGGGDCDPGGYEEEFLTWAPVGVEKVLALPLHKKLD